MELRHYWTIIRARLWLVALLTLAALTFSILNTSRGAVTYKAMATLAVHPQTDALVDQTTSGYGEYYRYVASELLNDDIGKLVEGSAFMEDVKKRGTSEYGRAPSGSYEVKKAHRLLMVNATAASSDDALLLTKIAADMLSASDAPYYRLLSDQNPRVTLVDAPAITGVTAASRLWLDIAVRTLLGLIAGLFVVFFLDYLDDTVRNRFEIEKDLGVPVLAEIPRTRSRTRRPSPAT